MNSKLLVVILAVFSIQGSLAANATAGTALNGAASGVTPATCASGGSFATTNCAFCDNGSPQGFCSACNVGYTLSASATGSPTLCTTQCNQYCLYCAGAAVPKASGAAADTSAGAGSTISSTTCQIENQASPAVITQAQAYCRNVTTSGVTQYATPGAVSGTAGTFPCYACAITQCVDCRLASGTPTSSATANQCRQCIDGYYLDSNTTTGSITTGTACTACSSIATIGTVSTTSGTFVVGVCNKCVNKGQCINATCTKTTYSSSGTASTDTSSYTFDMTQQKCVAKSSANRLVVAFVGVIAIAFVAIF